MFGDAATSATARLLLVARAGAWRASLVDALQQAWFVVAPFDDGEHLQLGDVPRADLAIVDLGLRSPSGVEVCAALRARSSILILAVGDNVPEDEIVEALAAGADGIGGITGSSRVLLARVRGLLRRAPVATTTGSRVLTCGGVALDSDDGSVMMGGLPLTLSDAEREILEVLMRNAGRVVTRSDLSARLSVVDLVEGDLEHHLRRLRDRLETPRSGCSIRTIRKVGVRLDEIEAAGASAEPAWRIPSSAAAPI